MANKKIPPDNTGKKYLTKITSKQRKYIDLYCSKYGEWSGAKIAIEAGYEKGSAHTRSAELLDHRKYPQVVMEIDRRLADFRKLWSIDKDKSMAALFKIKEKADAKGNYGVAAKCEELRGKLGGLYIEKLQTMSIHKELTAEDLTTKMRNIFTSKEHFQQEQRALEKELFPDESAESGDKKNR
jgi:phage terminase small subunit|tara:strand:+ start:142 stop:690 length:549 start_codon:yes stop_codon:yes gene_type:complete